MELDFKIVIGKINELVAGALITLGVFAVLSTGMLFFNFTFFQIQFYKTIYIFGKIICFVLSSYTRTSFNFGMFYYIPT